MGLNYGRRDVKWAKWIVWELENTRQRYQCTVQFRDFAAGMSFIRKMREPAELDCTLGLFSKSYFRSDYCNREMEAALTGKTIRLCIPQLRHRPDVNPGNMFLVRS